MPVVFYDIKLILFKAVLMYYSMNRQIQSLKHLIKYLKEIRQHHMGALQVDNHRFYNRAELKAD
jgi:hypothetical protein